MDKVSKFLLRISRDERERIILVIRDVIAGNTGFLNCKKLKGRTDEYRVRVGRIRIIFQKVDSKNIIIDVDFHNDNTY